MTFPDIDIGDAVLLARIIKVSKNTVFFGGAGVSTESNIPDFRSGSGLYTAKRVYGHDPEELLSRTFFERNPALFFRYYKENLICTGAKPNVAHIVLAKLEQINMLSAVITQNIDGLHQVAGSKNVIELHGSNRTQYCITCGKKYTLDYVLSAENCDGPVPKCNVCNGLVRPDIVLYEEQLNKDIMNLAIKTIVAADCLIVGGTSLVVYPAAGLLQYFRGTHLVLINKDKTLYDDRADMVIHDSIGKILSETIEHL
ncbi:NAD-dependent protein deacylase [Candidatus Bathycorpusculum sp.]|jgi:NAD-dependent deacetylase|uniref:NAD-dependent protein deacylase n=1 Tax=Candidatus Bathycorpusculum sp. TaxID=2994959 RepID=UPI00281AEACC|nr:NAD-dependent protein deacylase [Candidatus Termitimicrobium sp.]MCL2432328.1 NAD-dependent protein deacylase [Candidatus Termitimicrobium sp.]